MEYSEFLVALKKASEYEKLSSYIDFFAGKYSFDKLAAIYFFSGKSLREVREKYGYSRAMFSREFGIPIRTLENWESGERTPPNYVMTLIFYSLL